MSNEDKVKINRQLNDIKYGLDKLANEIDNIAEDILRTNRGIGQNYCASQLKSISREYRSIKNNLIAK